MSGGATHSNSMHKPYSGVPKRGQVPHKGAGSVHVELAIGCIRRARFLRQKRLPQRQQRLKLLGHLQRRQALAGGLQQHMLLPSLECRPMRLHGRNGTEARHERGRCIVEMLQLFLSLAIF
eukprot:SAG31_NODE_11_length_38734_cov_21.263854_27_plen_121_part_00